jgi:hypothetical protein
MSIEKSMVKLKSESSNSSSDLENQFLKSTTFKDLSAKHLYKNQMKSKGSKKEYEKSI